MRCIRIHKKLKHNNMVRIEVNCPHDKTLFYMTKDGF